jgi:SulP family sulfate permease
LRFPRALGPDLAAAVTIGAVSIPQAMAFALVAGVPAQHALYAMIVPGFVAAFLRRSPHLVTGATNTAALLVASLLASLNLPAGSGLGPTLAAVCLIAGLAQTAVGLSGLARLARYVSPAVVMGFTLGAAVLIAVGQLPALLGLEAAPAANAIAELLRIAGSLERVDPQALGLSAVTLAVIIGARALHPRLPGPLLAVGAGAVAVALLDGSGAATPELLGAVPRALPTPTLPDTDPAALRRLVGPALALAVLGMAENVSVGKSLARRTGAAFHAGTELRAQGVANLAGSLFGALPSSVSWTRSAVSLQAGARTPAAGMLGSLAVLLAVLAAGPATRFVPLASVAAVVLWIALRMVRLEDLQRIRRADRADFSVLIVTFGATLLFDLELAVFAGVGISLALVVHRAGLLRLSEFARAGSGELREIPLDPETGSAPITLLQAEGDLFFGVADELEQRLDAVASAGTRAIVLRLKRTHAIDGSASEALARFCERFHTRGGILLLCGLRPDMRRRIERSELGRALGADAIDETAGRPFESLERAIERARRHLGAPRDARLLRDAQHVDVESSWSI